MLLRFYINTHIVLRFYASFSTWMRFHVLRQVDLCSFHNVDEFSPFEYIMIPSSIVVCHEQIEYSFT